MTRSGIQLGSILMLTTWFAGIQLAGCASLDTQRLERYEPIVKLGVQVAVVRFLDSNPTYGNRVRVFVAKLGPQLDAQEAGTLTVVEATVRSTVNWQAYSAQEQLLIDNLIVLVRGEIQAALTANGYADDADEVLFWVTKFVGWIIEAVDVYEARPAPAEALEEAA